MEMDSTSPHGYFFNQQKITSDIEKMIEETERLILENEYKNGPILTPLKIDLLEHHGEKTMPLYGRIMETNGMFHIPPETDIPKKQSNFIEENYHIQYPMRESNTPKGLSKNDILTIEEFLSTGMKTYVLSYIHHPREAFFTRYENSGLKLNRKGGPAVTYFNGQEEYWIRGEKIPDNLIKRLFGTNHYNPMSTQELLTYPNIEMRRKLMECLGNTGLAKRLEKSLIYIHSDYLNGHLYTLYKSMRIENIELYFVKVQDASTSREYFLQVPPMNDALAAVAWTFYETKETYHPAIET